MVTIKTNKLNIAALRTVSAHSVSVTWLPRQRELYFTESRKSSAEIICIIFKEYFSVN